MVLAGLKPIPEAGLLLELPKLSFWQLRTSYKFEFFCQL